MLNELAGIHESLALRGINTQSWHSWIQPFKKGAAIVAEMDEAGQLVRVSTLAAEEVSLLRNIAPDFHNSFPGLNINCPLLSAPDGALWNQPETLWKAATQVTGDSPLAYQAKDLRRLDRLIGDFPAKEIAPRLNGNGTKIRSTVALLQRLESAKREPEAFLHELALQIIKAAQEGRMPQQTAVEALYGKPNKKQQRLDAWKATLILDVSDMDQYDYRVADPAVASEWSRLLLAADAGIAANSSAFRCALSGNPDTPMDEKMPSPNLKVLGPTVLMSMNPDIPCQARYGRISTEIFPVGRKSVQDLNDALLFITDTEHRDKTWRSVPNGTREQGDLLISYLEEEPNSQLPIVRFFSDSEPDPVLEWATYKARTEDIYQALQLRANKGGGHGVSIIVLSKIDKGRAQVLFSASYSVASILEGRDRWLAGAANIPRISMPFPVKKGQPAKWLFGHAPSPAEVAISFKRQWLRAGQNGQSVPGVDISRIYSLLLDPGAREAPALLDRYLSLTEPLLAGVGRVLRGSGSLSEAARKEALIAVAIYGILLLRQGRTKEVYMNTRDYLLGQFLQMADRLHKLYCEKVRDGSIPPQLIGNAAIPMALQSPRRALEVLGNRMPVYLAWADSYKGGGPGKPDDIGLVKWHRKEIERLATALKEESLDTRVSTTGKAELFLGYLASTKQEEENTSK